MPLIQVFNKRYIFYILPFLYDKLNISKNINKYPGFYIFQTIQMYKTKNIRVFTQNIYVPKYCDCEIKMFNTKFCYKIIFFFSKQQKKKEFYFNFKYSMIL